uniref:hypothetical protein n=1 Tax=Agrobacterium larrymoorei TaxID=160699 RepID=UPI001F25827B|nr:hypothetical protein [Agrobacterium larrymoorei]
MCYLMEMQWKHASWFNANEFLHGAFEVVQPDTPVLLFKGEDDTRAVIDRVETFLNKNTKRCLVVDSKDYTLPGVPASMRGDSWSRISRSGCDRVWWCSRIMRSTRI